MQPPTPTELQIYRKVATWLANNLTAAAIDASIEAVKAARAQRATQHLGDNPLAVFDQFPDGAKVRQLEARSRAFRRLSAEVSRQSKSRQERAEAWQELGVLATIPPSGNGLFLTLL